MRPVCALLPVLAGCGRFGFEARSSQGDDASNMRDSRTADTSTLPDGAGEGQLLRFGLQSSTQATSTVSNVTLAVGDTVLVVTHRRIGDTTAVSWGAMQLTEDEPIPNFGPEPMYLSIWSYRATAQATATITATGGANPSDLFVFVVRQTAVAAFDKSADATGTGASADSTATAMTSTAHELVLGVVGSDTGTNFDGMWDSSFTELVNQANGLGIDTTIAYRIVTAQGMYTATNAGFAARTWGAAVVTYKLQ